MLSFRRKPESSIYGRLQIIWTPAFAGVTTFYELVNFDGLVKSRKTPIFVIPAEAGIQSNQGIWTPAFAGVTALGTFYEAVNLALLVAATGGIVSMKRRHANV